MSIVSQPTPSYPTSSSPTTSFHKSRPTCTLSLAHAHVDAASFAQGNPSATSLTSLSVPPPNLPDRSELQSPIQEDRVHQAFRFPVSAKSAGEGMSSRGKGKWKGEVRGGTNCIPFPRSLSRTPSPPVSPTSSTTTTTSYSRSAASSTTSISSVESTSTCSSAASLELKLASFPVPPSTPPHVLLRVRQAQTQPRPIPASPGGLRRARKLSVLPRSNTSPTRAQTKPKSPNSTRTATPPPRNILTLAAALGKATAPKLSASASVPPASAKRADVPRLMRRGWVDDRDGVGMERPGSPVPHSRGERRRVIDDVDVKKQQKKAQDEEEDLKSALTFEPPPYSAPPPPYSPTVSPPPPPSGVPEQARALPTPPVEEIRIHAPVPKPAYVLPPPQSSSSAPHNPPPTRRAATRVSASEIRILLTLYRTVMVGLEKRYRAAEEAIATTKTEKVIGKEKAKEKARFPLVEEDDEQPDSAFWVVDDTEEEEERAVSEKVTDEGEEEYIPRRRPPPPRVPPNSPVGSPPSSGTYVRPSCNKVAQAPATQKSSTTADFDVQDALLAIRLRGFLKAQGVSETELDVVFDEVEGEDEEDDETMAAEIDRALAEMHAATAAENANATKGTLVVVETEEEGMHALPPPPRPRTATGEKRPLRSSPSPPLVINKSGSRNGRTTSPSPPPSAAYMIALLTMRHRYASRRSGNGAGPKGHSGYPIWRRSSALKSVAWVAPLDEDEEESLMSMIQEDEEDGDVDSVVELYAGMC